MMLKEAKHNRQFNLTLVKSSLVFWRSGVYEDKNVRTSDQISQARTTNLRSKTAHFNNTWTIAPGVFSVIPAPSRSVSIPNYFPQLHQPYRYLNSRYTTSTASFRQMKLRNPCEHLISVSMRLSPLGWFKGNIELRLISAYILFYTITGSTRYSHHEKTLVTIETLLKYTTRVIQ